MLTDLTFLQTGQRFPPPCETPRLRDYHDNRRLFEDEHSEVYKEHMKRITRVIGNFEEIIAFPVIFNYQKLMSLKLADLLFGEPPKITANDDAKQEAIDRALLDTDLINTAYMAAIDLSRYGDGIMSVSRRDSPDGIIPVVDAITPEIWFPVVDKANIRRIAYHVLAYPYAVDTEQTIFRLHVQIHKPDEPGDCEEHTYALTGTVGSWLISGEIPTPAGETAQKIETGFGVCPLFRVPNVLTSDRIFGTDDYRSISSIVSELIVRVAQISRILDVHANPSMSGPLSALEQDISTGAWRLKVGDYFSRNSADDPAPEYITWDASLDANFKQIELLTNQLYSISEMGSAIFGDSSNKTGQVASGTALRRLMMSPLAKARRNASRFDPVLKRVVALCAEVYGVKIMPHEISIAWNDGLPDDDAEQANIMSIRTGGKPTISQYSAIQRLDNLSDADTETELEMIREDANATNPVMLGSVDANDEPEEPEEPEGLNNEEDDPAGN
ncbi:MAG: phage portal protein [Oscillospiraceae bacterium]